jgi:hypothetical protein
MKKILFLLLLPLIPACGFAAVGCGLNDPDRDVSRMFPNSTGYKTRYLSIKDEGGQPLLEKIEKRLGDKFKGLYETIDVPYTLYDIYRATEVVGHIHGVNEKGKYGGIQVFLAFNKTGAIKSFYIQKLTSRAAKAMRSPGFGRQFEGLALKDFESYKPGKPASAPAGIDSPQKAGEDFQAVLRAVKKNLILMNEFVFTKREK